MMKILFISFLTFSFTVFAETKPLAEWSVSSIVSEDLGYDTKYLSQVRYRAITTYSIRGESPSTLVVEKIIEPTAPGNPYTLAWSKKVAIPLLDKVNKNSEAGYMGNFPNMKWEKMRLSFDLFDPDKKRNSRCSIDDVEGKSLQANCK